MAKIVFLNGSFVSQEDSKTESNESLSMSDTPIELKRRASDVEGERDSLTIDLLSSLQNDLNNITTEKQKIVDLMNCYRMAIFPKDQFESLKGHEFVQANIADMLKLEGGSELADLYLKHTRELCGKISVFVEDNRSKVLTVKKQKQSHSDAMAQVEKIRSGPKTSLRKGPEKYTPFEQAIRNFRKSFAAKFTRPQIIKMFMALPQGKDKTYEEIEAIIEKQVSREIAKESK